jgi:hypothetical protein
MDAFEDVSEIRLRIKAVQLCGFNDRHGAGECFRTGVGPGEEPVFSSDSKGRR